MNNTKAPAESLLSKSQGRGELKNITTLTFEPYGIESLKDLNFRGCIEHEVQLCSLINPSQIVFPYLSHRFCTEPLKMAIFGFSKQIFSAKNQLYLFKNDFLLRIFD